MYFALLLSQWKRLKLLLQKEEDMRSLHSIAVWGRQNGLLKSLLSEAGILEPRGSVSEVLRPCDLPLRKNGTSWKPARRDSSRDCLKVGVWHRSCESVTWAHYFARIWPTVSVAVKFARLRFISGLTLFLSCWNLEGFILYIYKVSLWPPFLTILVMKRSAGAFRYTALNTLACSTS